MAIFSSKYTGSFQTTASFGTVDIDGHVSASSFQGIFIGALSSSAQIADEISGSFTKPSASFSTRTTDLEAASASFSTRVTAEESNVDTLQARNIDTGIGLTGGGDLTSDRTLTVNFADSDFATRISGSFTKDSSSLASRITTAESSVSALQADSASFSTRITTEENNVDALQARQILGGVGLKDGGDLTSDRTLNIDFSDSTFQTNISGSFTKPSASFSTRVTDLKNDSASFSTRITTEEGNVDVLQARNIDTGLGLSGGGDLTSDRTLAVDFSDSTFASNISGSFTKDSASFSTRVTTNESYLNQSVKTDSKPTFAGMTIEGKLTTQELVVSSSVTSMSVQYASGSTQFGDDTDDTHKFTGSLDVTGSFSIDGAITSNGYGLISSSAQIADEISGSFTKDSASFSTRITTEEGNVDVLQARNIDTGIGLTGGGDLTSDRTLTVNFADADFATRISGSFTKDSASLASRITTNRGLVSGSFVAPSSSFSTRTTDLETASASFSTRVTTEEANVDALQAIDLTAGVGLSGGGDLTDNRTFNVDFTDTTLKANVSGAFTATSASIASDIEEFKDGTITRVSGSSVSTGSFGKLVGDGSDLTGVGGFPFTGSAGILGSLNVDGNIHATQNISGSSVSASNLSIEAIKGNWTNAGNTVADGGTFTTIDIDGGTITGITDLAVADGGTGAGTFTDGGVLLGSGTDAITATAVLGNGELLIGDNSGDPNITTLTGTTNQITVTNGAGSITLSTPQDLDTSADVTFDSVTLDDLTASKLVGSNGSKKLVSIDLDDFVSGTANQITVTDDTDGTITLSTPQNIATTSNVQFNHVTASGNISSSATITALQYGGDVSGSSTSTGSFGRVEATTGKFTNGLMALSEYSMEVAEYISHFEDSDTYIRFQDNTLDLSAEGALFRIQNNIISGSSTSTGSFGTLESVKIDGTPVYGSNGNHLGIGEATAPGTIDGFTSSGNLTILNVKDSSHGARVTIQGQDASLDLVDNGATGNQRWFSFYNNDQMVYARGLNSAGNSVTQNFLSFDLSNGNVAIGTQNSGTERLDVTGNIKASGNISGSSTSTGSFGRVDSPEIYVSDAAGIYADKIRRYTDSSTTTKIVLNDEVIKLHAGSASDETLYLSGNVISGSSISTGSFSNLIANRIKTRRFRGFSPIHFEDGAILSGSFELSASVDISGSSTSTGSFGSLVVSDRVQGSLTVASDFIANGNGAAGKSVLGTSGGHATVDLNNSSGAHTVRINAGGDSFFNGGGVGIGTTSPTKPLQVTGDISQSGDFYGPSGLTINWLNANTRIAGSNSGGYLQFDVGGTSNVLKLTSTEISGSSKSTGSFGLIAATGTGVSSIAGDFGIGTTSPNISGVTKAVTVNGSGAVIYELATGGTRKGNMYHDGSTSMTITNNANGTLTLGTNNTARLTIAAAGDVTLTHDLTTPNISVAGNIVHTDNVNTKIAFDTNEVQMFSNNNERLKVADGVVNVIAMLSGSGEVEFRKSLLVDQNITGSGNLQIAGNIVAQGDVTAERFIVKSTVSTITSSFSSGSTIFGDDSGDTHKFTGSLQISGGLEVQNGNLEVAGNISGSSVSTGSFGYLEVKATAPLLHLNGGGGDSAARYTEDGSFRGGFVKYDGSNNVFRIGTHENNNRTLNDDIVGINIARSTGIVTIPTSLVSDGDITANGYIAGNGTFGSQRSNILNNFNSYIGLVLKRTGAGTADFLRLTDSSENIKFSVEDDGKVTFTGDMSGSSTSTFTGGTSTFTHYGGNVSGSSTSTGSFGKVSVNGISNISSSIALALGGKLSFNGSTANGIVTYGNSTTADVESNLTFDGTTLGVTGAIASTGNISGSSVSTGSFGSGFFDGNVGIGTTNTRGRRLTIEAAADTSNDQILYLKQTPDDYGWSFNIAGGTTGTLHIKNVANGTETDVLMLKQDGTVGIGQTDPSYKLDVTGTGRFTGDLTLGGNATPSGNNAKNLGGASNVWANIYGYDIHGTRHISGSSTSTGSFGELQVRGAAQEKISLFGNAQQFINFGDAADTDSGRIQYDHNNNQFQFYANATNILRVLGSGYVLPASNEGVSLGSTSLKWKELVVNHVSASGNISGSATSTGSFGRVEIGGGGSVAGWDTKLWLKGTTGAATTLHIESTNTAAVSALRFETNGNNWYWAAGGSSQGYFPNKFYLYNEGGSVANPLTVQNDGKIGLGTRNPAYQLDNTGTFRATGKSYFENHLITSPNWGRLGVAMGNLTTGNDPSASLHVRFSLDDTATSAALREVEDTDVNYDTFVNGLLLENTNDAANTGGKVHIRSGGSRAASVFLYGENAGSAGNSRMSLWTENSATAYERISLESNGDVLFGTTVTKISGSSTSTGSFGKLILSENLHIGDSGFGYFGTGDDFKIQHNGSHTYLVNETGDIYYRQKFAGASHIFQQTDSNTTVVEILSTGGLVVEGGTTPLIRTTGNIVSTGANKVISGSVTSTGSFGRVVATTLHGDGSGLTGVTAFPFTGSANISGSLKIKHQGRELFNVLDNFNSANSGSDQILFSAHNITGAPILQAEASRSRVILGGTSGLETYFKPNTGHYVMQSSSPFSASFEDIVLNGTNIHSVFINEGDIVGFPFTASHAGGPDKAGIQGPVEITGSILIETDSANSGSSLFRVKGNHGNLIEAIDNKNIGLFRVPNLIGFDALHIDKNSNITFDNGVNPQVISGSAFSTGSFGKLIAGEGSGPNIEILNAGTRYQYLHQNSLYFENATGNIATVSTTDLRLKTNNTIGMKIAGSGQHVTFPVANQKISGSSTSTGSFGKIEMASSDVKAHIDFTQGTHNTTIGFGGTGQVVTTGATGNVFVGYGVGSQVTTGDQNVAVGYQNLTSGNSTGNTAFGYRALKAVTSGIGNVGIGRLAGDSVQSGNYNIAIGQGTGFTGTGATNQIGIGYDVTVPGDNQTVIGASPQTHVIFGGSNTLISGSAGSTGSFGMVLGDGSGLTNLPASPAFPFTGSAGLSGSLSIDRQASATGSTIFDVKGKEGTLLSVVDQMSGSIFNVTTVAGIPIIEAMSNGDVNIGPSGSSIGRLFINGAQMTSVPDATNGSQSKISGSSVSTGSFGTLKLAGGKIQGNTTIGGTLAINGIANVSASISAVGSGGSGTGFPFTGSAGLSGSLHVKHLAVATGSTLLDVIGSEGTLFSVVNDMSGSIFSTATAAGIPVIEAFSDGKVEFGPLTKVITGSKATASFGKLIVNGTEVTNFTVTNNVNNRVLTGDGTGANAETALTFDGTKLVIGGGGYDLNSASGMVLNSDDNGVSTSIKGSDGNGTFTVGDGKVTFTSQNVGIGVASPEYKLHVDGDIRATGDVIANRLVVSSSVSHITSSFSSGSTIFGDSSDDTHRFTGSLYIKNGASLPSIHVNSAAGDGHIIVESTHAASSGIVDIRSVANRDSSIIFREGTTAKAQIFNDSSDDQLVLTDGNNSNTLFIRSGRVGIGAQPITGCTLYVDGDIKGDAFIENSSIRLKTNVETLENPLDKISKLRGVSYNLKKDNKPSIGMIAEEVNEVFPELVDKDDSGKVQAMSYTRMTAVLLEAIKELKEEVKELKQTNIYNKYKEK